jgi:predicted transcriptional regulator
MATTTVRIPEDKRDMLKILASIEKRDMQMILSDLIDEYLERNKETLEILSSPQWMDTIQEGLMASGRGETIRWRDKQSGKSS